MIEKGELSSRGAKDLITKLFEKEGDAEKWLEENNLLQVSDTGALEKIAQIIISANPTVVADFKNGKSRVSIFRGAGNERNERQRRPE